MQVLRLSKHHRPTAVHLGLRGPNPLLTPRTGDAVRVPCLHRGALPLHTPLHFAALDQWDGPGYWSVTRCAPCTSQPCFRSLPFWNCPPSTSRHAPVRLRPTRTTGTLLTPSPPPRHTGTGVPTLLERRPHSRGMLCTHRAQASRVRSRRLPCVHSPPAIHPPGTPPAPTALNARTGHTQVWRGHCTPACAPGRPCGNRTPRVTRHITLSF